MRKFLNGIDASNQRVGNVADPSSGTDAANKNYVDTVARGLQIKESVRACATANINLAAPGAMIDGAAMISGDRFLAPVQTTVSQKGIYIWNGAAAAATRSLDADTGTELRPGVSVYVTEGTVNGDKQFVITSDGAVTIGTSDMTWTQVGGGNSYTASNGVQMVGNDVRGVAAPSGGLTVGPAGFAIDTNVVARKISGTIGNGSLAVIPVTHTMGTKDVQVELRQMSDDACVETDWVATDVSTVTFTFAAAPPSNSLRFTIIG